MSTSSSAISEPLSQAIVHLRQLTQISVQASWSVCEHDLPVERAVDASTWGTWATAERNAKDHLAWQKGRVGRWFSQTIVVPPSLQGYPLAGLGLRFALLWWAEVAQVFVNGQLVQEGDLFDCAPRLLLSPAVQPGDRFEVAIRLVSPGHDPGALMRSLCAYETAAGAEPPEPAFVASELEVLQTYLTAFAPENLAQVATAVTQLDWAKVSDRRDFDRSLAQLRHQLLPLSALLKHRKIYLLGHAHLDMAWLWTLDETWKAAERTFESVLKLQQDFAELTFCHSTPALYDWMEQHRPELFDRIRRQITAGTWEVVGAMWVEPELNLIAGESIARHLLYGQRYLQAKFGSINRIAWLPDTFGFNWQLPQLLKLGGIDYFVTQKLRWNDTTKFPHAVFAWQAPDGTQVLSLMSAPIGEGIDPVKMAAYACDWETQTGLANCLWLPGVGDHGGGPTRDMLEVARRWQQSPFFPQLEFTTAIAFLQEIELATEAQTKATAAEPEKSIDRSTALFTPQSIPSLPVWNHELYLEFHRGCYTTHADQKQLNRRSEDLLYQAELWASLATLSAGIEYPQDKLEAAWKQALLNQFHDILPGTAIAEVFSEANQNWQELIATCQQIIHRSLTLITQQIALPSPPHPGWQAIVVFNPCSWTRSGIVSLAAANQAQASQIISIDGAAASVAQDTWGNRYFLAENIPAIGYRTFWVNRNLAASNGLSDPPAVQDFILENPNLRIVVSPTAGTLDSVFDKIHQRQVLSGAGNQLQAFTDQGQYWDAWNIAPDYQQHPLPAAELVDIRWLEVSNLRSALQVTRRIGQSTFEQIYILEAASPLLKIETVVDWQERHVLVKAAFPLNLAADKATYEIPYGAIQRSTQPQGDREQAQWEVSGLRWADLSDGESGVSLLTDSKHGFDAQPSQLRLTLLRGPEFPDLNADRGQHRFTYAIYPHEGSWQAARTVQVAQELSQPLQAMPLPENEPLPQNPLPPETSLLHLGAEKGTENLVLTAFKQAEASPDAWVLRCYECCGTEVQAVFQSSLELELVGAIDLLEHPATYPTLQGQTAIVRPWEIASFKVVKHKSSVK